METPDLHNRIAIIGQAGRFPSAPNVNKFWQMLADGRSGAKKISDAALLAAGVSRKTLADPNYVKVAYPIPDMECFDAGFFGFSPKEASILDPQHRHFLECGWEALEDAGHMPENFDGRIGVFAGSGMQAYLPYNLLTNADLVEEIGFFLLRHTGNDKDFLTTRLSYLLNLTGPSVAVQTACSTSLVAIHMAVNSLLNMECEMAIAGGVTIELPHHVGYHFSQGEILSPDGRCRAFDDDSQGTVFGSAAALVVLRRYEDAIADGDDIKAVILSTAINNDGSDKANYLAPSVDGQAEAAAEAVALAGVEPQTISYIETHGTGTPIGDPIELSALSQVYGDAEKKSIGIGSVKTNIAHTDTAAAGASVIKVVEALRHKVLPESLYFETPNSRFDFENSPFYVVDENREWPAGDTPRRAAVNSLGVGGTNAHVIIEEAPDRTPTNDSGAWKLFPFSARTDSSLQETRKQWRHFLDRNNPNMMDVAFTLRKGRRHFPERLAIAARNQKELAENIAARKSSLARRFKASDEPPKLIFLFPGGGAQYPGAGAEMQAQSPVFAAALARCFDNLPANAPSDLETIMLRRGLEDQEAREKLGRSGYAIPALFILEYTYAKLWESWGIKPDAILAHSVGEYAGAVVAGAMKLSDALKIVTLRGQVMDAAPEGAMTTIPLCEEKTRALIGDKLDIAALNTPEATVVSGKLADIEKLENRLLGGDHEARRIHIDVAAHSRQLDGQLETFRDGFEGVTFGSPEIPMVSSMRGDWGKDDDFISADYWVRHLRQTVRFTDAVAAALDTENCIVLEVGPGQTLGPLVEMADNDYRPAAILPSGPTPKDNADEFGVALASFGGLWAAGHVIDWEKAVPSEGQRISLPTYAFDKTRHWIEPGKAITADDESEEAFIIPRITDTDDWFEILKWQKAPRTIEIPEAGSRWLVFAGNDPISDVVLDYLAESGSIVTVVRAGEAYSNDNAQYTLRPDNTDDYEALADSISDIPDRILSLWALDNDLKEHIFASSYLIARMLQQADAPVGTKLVFASEGAASVNGEVLTSPFSNCLLGAVRSGPREIPGLKSALVDIDTGNDLSETVQTLLGEVVGESDADHIALRSDGRYIRIRQSAPQPGPEGLPIRLRDRGVYVITGGTGGIGRLIALWLAKSAKANIALLSRTAKPDPVLMEQIKEAGGNVSFVSTDVTDQAKLKAALSAVRQTFGEINGVIHAAGILDDAPLSVKPLSEALAIMAPKVLGGENLDHLLPEGTLDFFAMISSTSVEVGPAGQVAYVAANAVLEALAGSRSDGISIAWGVWRDTGMAARAYGTETGTGATVDTSPLIGKLQETTDGQIRFERQLDPDLDWELTEHVVGGVPVLPGTAYFELAFEAARTVLNGRPFEIRALSMAQPMVFSEGLPRRMSIVLKPVHDGYDLRIESRLGPADQPTEHVQLLIKVGKSVDSSIPESLLKEPQLTPTPKNPLATQEDIIAFGPRWDNVGDAEKNSDTAEGVFRLPDEFLSDLKTHPVHPALLDMAATIGLNVLNSNPDSPLYAPMSAERIRIFSPLPQKITSKAVLVAHRPGQFVSFDILISTPDGAPVMVIDHLALRAIERSSLAETSPAPRLTDQLLVTGIRNTEADDVFARVFSHNGKNIVISPVSLDLVSLAMTEVHKTPSRSKKPTGAGSSFSDPVTAKLADIWGEILGIDDIGIDDDFFALGGHSLNAVRMFGRVRKEYGVNLPLATLFEAPTIGLLSNHIKSEAGISDDTAENGATETSVIRRPWSPLVTISKGSEYVRPLFFIHGAGGNILNFRPLAGFLDPSIPFFGLRALGSDGGTEIDVTIEAMAERYLRAIREYQPVGPYRLSGYSGGGVVAYEMTRQLQLAGEEVEHLIFFDTISPDMGKQELTTLQKLWAARRWDIKFALDWRNRRRAGKSNQEQEQKIRDLLKAGKPLPDELTGIRMTSAFVAAQDAYETPSIDTNVTIFKARQASTQFIAAGPQLGWEKYISGTIEIMEFDCDHFTMMVEPTIAKIGDLLNKLLLEESPKLSIKS